MLRVLSVLCGLKVDIALRMLYYFRMTKLCYKILINRDTRSRKFYL